MATSDPAAWRPVLDGLKSLTTQLGDLQVPGRDAQAAADACEWVENQLWRWRRSVEAAYLDKTDQVPNLVAQVALQDAVPPLAVLQDLVREGALKPQWWKLDRWATRHGVRVWPELDESEEE